MSTHDMNIANQGFPAFRADLNNALAALVSNSSSATEPTTTYAYMFWADTTNDLLKQRNAANDGWVSILTLSTGEPVIGGTPDKIEEGNSSIEIVDTGTGYAAVVIDGVETARFKSGGNFGVGTTNPPSKLSVVGGATYVWNGVGAGVLETKTDGNDAIINAKGTANAELVLQVGSGTEAARLDLNSNLKFNSGYGSVATAYGCRVWVNFNGTGTVAIRGSGGVSSVTDNGAGDYTINFSFALPDQNYSFIASTDSPERPVSVYDIGATTSVRILTSYGTSGVAHEDKSSIYCAAFR